MGGEGPEADWIMVRRQERWIASGIEGWMNGRWLNGQWINGRKAGRWSSWQPEIENLYLYLLSSMAPQCSQVRIQPSPPLTKPSSLAWAYLLDLISCLFTLLSSGTQLVPAPSHLCSCLLALIFTHSFLSLGSSSRPAGLSLNTLSSRKPSLMTLSNFIYVTWFISLSGFVPRT